VPIKLKEMHVNKIHTGRFLLCRVIRDPFYITGTLVLIQDTDNQVENLSLYNFSKSYMVDPKLLLPNNSILIIKEPFLKNMISSPTDFHIRVESPTDLIILSDLDKDDKYSQYFLDKWTDIKDPDRSLSFDELNKKGNGFFVGQNYHSAIRYYTKALNLAKDDKAVKNSDVKKTLNNRSAALLKLDKYYQAYQDTVKSTQIENVNDSSDLVNDEKAFFRMGKAAYSMRQFDVALEAFEKCLALNLKNKDAKEEMIRTKKRLFERSTGKYDMKLVIEQALVQKQPRLDLADFVSDDIEIRNVNNDPNYKGECISLLYFLIKCIECIVYDFCFLFKGVFAKNDIKAKTLLVASKAASFIYENECINNACVTYNLNTKTIQKPTETANFSNLITILQNNPYLSKEFYKLYSGPIINRVEPITELIIDTSRVQAIINFNGFSKGQHFSDIASNSLDGKADDKGVWIIPSYFNHSCVPNGQRFIYSDFMMIYASMYHFRKII
jgi:tetratricopeptide (TPR) repeat protein